MCWCTPNSRTPFCGKATCVPPNFHGSTGGGYSPAPESSPEWEIPRRIRVDRMEPAELAIRQALLAVEAMPAHPDLTEAVILLSQAQNHVADFIDHFWKRPA